MSNPHWRCVEVLGKQRTFDNMIDGYIVLEQHTQTGDYRKRVLKEEEL